MITLSVRQPWAHCIIYAGKDIENRGFRTRHRGRLAIHASRTFDDAGYAELLARGVPLPAPDEMPRGVVIGTVTLDDVVTDSDSEWFEGPVGLVLSEPEPIEPVPCRGMPGFFHVDLI